MGTGKLGLKLIGTHAIMSIVEFFLMIPLMGLWENNQIYQWAIGLIFILIFWLIIYADLNYISQTDIKRDLFWKAKGFVAGLIASIPAIILLIVTLVIEGSLAEGTPNFAEIGLRIWLAPYTKVFVSFQDLMPQLTILPIILLPIVSGISYLDGPRKRDKILNAIAESDAMRAEKSKVDR